MCNAYSVPRSIHMSTITWVAVIVILAVAVAAAMFLQKKNKKSA
jgi:disulfide bond formation protein DsbB